MHYLHKILVYIPDAVEKSKEYERNEMINVIRTYAEYTTEDFSQIAFGWRETDSAGRWRNEYPVNVLLAEDDVERFINEVSTVKEIQANEIRTCLAKLEKTIGTDLKHITDVILKRHSYMEEMDGADFMTAYYLHSIAAQLYGEYLSNSFFYNTHNCTAFLYPEDMSTIKESPNDWALVMFDYHN